MRRFIALVFVGTILSLLFSGFCFAEEAQGESANVIQSGDYEYVLLEDGTAQIVDYIAEYPTAEIPETIDGNTVTSIGARALADCNYLDAITIPNTVISIGDFAFSGGGVTEITIPDSVTEIGINPFAYVSSLQKIIVSPDHPVLATIDGVLFRKTDKTILSYPQGKENTDYSIPDGIAAIGDGAFYYCNALTAITIPDSVTSIGVEAFGCCDSLTEITIPNSVTSIGDAAFASCDSLNVFPIPNSVTVISPYCFADCDSLTEVVIPDSVTTIGDEAFVECVSLATVTIPDSVTTIGEGAFGECEALTTVAIPDSVTSIGEYAFYTDSGNLTLIVSRDSYAAQYAKDNGVQYTYPDANDWLNG